MSIKLLKSKPTNRHARSNVTALLLPDTRTRPIAASYDLRNRHLPMNESIEPDKSSSSVKITQKPSNTRRKSEQFAFVIVKILNNEQGYRRKKTFSSSLYSHRARRKWRFEMLNRSFCLSFESNKNRHLFRY